MISFVLLQYEFPPKKPHFRRRKLDSPGDEEVAFTMILALISPFFNFRLYLHSTNFRPTSAHVNLTENCH